MPDAINFTGTQELFSDARPGDNPTDSDHLWSIVVRRPTDFEPYGYRHTDDREHGGDCSCECKWFIGLEGNLAFDWGVCTNPRSPRAGLLTWEHMGCPEYEPGEIPPTEDFRLDEARERRRAEFVERLRAERREASDRS
jgi:hypothetical protein